MSTTVRPPATPPPAPAARRRRAALPSWALPVGGFLLAFLLLAVASGVGDAPDLTSPDAFGAALRLAVPIGLAGLGGLYAERSGIVNIGLEGMMVLGTFGAGYAGWHWGPWWALVGGMVGGLFGGLLHAVATVTFGVDQIISGVAINILGVGYARFLADQFFNDPATGGSVSLSPPIQGSIGTATLPVLSGGEIFGWQSPDILGWLVERDWFFVSDVAGLFKGLTTDLSWATVIALALFPLTAYFLWHTATGLRLRACGEKPSAADSLGVGVYKMRYLAVSISGMLAGLGGAYLVILSTRYREGQVGGRGFLGLAALIFGNWNPYGVAAGAGLFGYADALNLRSNESVRALFLFAGLALALLAAYWLWRRKAVRAVLLAAVGACSFWYFATTDSVPNQFVYMTPYVVTLLVLAFASQRLRPPAEEGKPWRKGSLV